MIFFAYANALELWFRFEARAFLSIGMGESKVMHTDSPTQAYSTVFLQAYYRLQPHPPASGTAANLSHAKRPHTPPCPERCALAAERNPRRKLKDRIIESGGYWRSLFSRCQAIDWNDENRVLFGYLAWVYILHWRLYFFSITPKHLSLIVQKRREMCSVEAAMSRYGCRRRHVCTQ